MAKGKVEKMESQEGFDLLEDPTTTKKKEEGENKAPQSDVYNVLGSLKIQYVTKKSKNGKINLTIQLQNKEQLNVLLNNLQKIQNALANNEYIVTIIAQRHPYNLSLVITKKTQY